jgi:ubiquinone/menaquinone biosynthesis C-methylase UbiE
MILDRNALAHEQRLREEFDRRAQAGAGHQELELRRLAEAALAGRAPRLDERVLDVGCGDGWLCRWLSPQCPEGAVVGIDLSGEMIHLAREASLEFDNVLHTLGSAEEIPWAEDYFTRVVSLETAYYCHSAERAVAEMFRVTAWSGRFEAMLSFYRENPATHHWSEQTEVPLQLRGEEEWKELFVLRGVQDVETSRVHGESTASDVQPGPLWRTRDERERFHEMGALLISGSKPGIPPPGPLSSEPDPPRPPEPPDPLRILR